MLKNSEREGGVKMQSSVRDLVINIRVPSSVTSTAGLEPSEVFDNKKLQSREIFLSKQNLTGQSSHQILPYTPSGILRPSKIPSVPIYRYSPNDTRDPSFTNLKISYDVICRKRLNSSYQQMQAQFRKEIQDYALLQRCALDGVRIHRLFGNTERQNNSTQKKMTLTKKQKFKIDQMLTIT